MLPRPELYKIKIKVILLTSTKSVKKSLKILISTFLYKNHLNIKTLNFKFEKKRTFQIARNYKWKRKSRNRDVIYKIKTNSRSGWIKLWFSIIIN